MSSFNLTVIIDITITYVGLCVTKALSSQIYPVLFV